VTLQDCASAAAARLLEAGWTPEESRRDATLLARVLLGWEQARWLTGARDEAPADFADRLSPLVARRAGHEPLAYIAGEREFYGRAFAVSPDVLIPRPDSEVVVNAALDCLAGLPAPPLVVDVGTGSGCLAITLACERPDIRMVATDTSAAALRVARQNAARLAGPGHIRFRQGSLLAGLAATPDLIVSNPPYVREHQRATMPREVLEFEPATALFAGPDGLDVMRELVATAASRLSSAGWLVTEIGCDQADEVRALVDARPELSFVRVVRDIEARPRVVVARRT
jgi:release factor glutamine methyltransferase